MKGEEIDNEDNDKMKDDTYQKIEHQRVTTGIARCFPFYI